MEDSELEEGEACYYKDDTSIDPDIALSYIGEKLHSVLGHLQKDFEGGVSAENLGSKFGGYGSFLPTYQRSPSVWSQTKTPQTVQNFSSPRSPNVLPMEDTPQNSIVPSDASALRLGTASRSLNKLHNVRAPAGDVPAKHDSYLSSAQVVEKFPPKHEPILNKPSNPTDQRKLKVRIKVGSENTARKNAAIYSGLGLISPSSSMGNSPEDSGEMPSLCQETLDESPDNIIQIMTSFPVPGSLMLSPLHESLLCLTGKEKFQQNNKPVPSIRNGQEDSNGLADDSAFSMGDKKVPKEKKTKIVEKSDNLVLKREIGTGLADNRITLVKQEVAVEAKKMENETLSRKQSYSNDSKLKPILNPVCNVVDRVKGAGAAPVVPREAERNVSMKKREVSMDGMEDRLSLSIGLVKEESLESISDQEVVKNEKKDFSSSLMEKICESKLRNSHTDVSTNLREDGQSKRNKVSTPSKVHIGVSKCKSDHSTGGMDHFSRKVVGETATYLEQDETKMPLGVGKSQVEGKKKSKGSQCNGKLVSEAKESLMAGVYEVRKEKKKAGKMHNSKLQKDIRKVHDNHNNVRPKMRVEKMDVKTDSLERPFGDRTKDSFVGVVEKEQYVSLDKLKEISTHKKVDTQLTSDSFLKEVANDGRPFAKGDISEMELTSVAPVVIEEDWVCCDHCQTWRLLPYGTKPEQLPEKWLCSMLNWLPGMNNCKISEEETTKALRALYQCPLPESQSNLQNHVDRTAAGTSSVDAWHFDDNHLNLSSHGMPTPRKKKQGSKGTPYSTSTGGPIQISGSTKDFRQEVVKRRNSNDMNQPILESNLMRNSIVQNLSKSHNLPVEKNTSKQKEKHANSGDAKQKKLKSKREADLHEYATTKKMKADVALGTDNYWTTEPSGNIDKIVRGSGSGLPGKAAVKGSEKHDERCSSKNAKSARKEKVQVSAKELGGRALVLMRTGPLDMKTYDEKETSMKKRKLKDWQEGQTCVDTSQNYGNHLSECKVIAKEESSDIEFRKAKKFRVSTTEGKESSKSKNDNSLTRKNKASRIILSGSRENPVHGGEEVRSIEKDQQPRKHKSKVASKPASDDLDLLKRDLGAAQFSRAATSSSSKISDSHKSRAHFPEVKGSPVESVSSSPMRTSNLNKLSPARRDILGKAAVRNGDFPVMDSPRISLNGEDNFESNRFGKACRGKVSGVSHSESLGFPLLDFQDNDASQKFGGKSKSSVKSLSEFQNDHLLNCDAYHLESPDPGDQLASDHCHNKDRINKDHYDDKPLFSEKSVKGSSLLSKDKGESYVNNFERVKLKVFDPPSEMEVLNPKQILRDEVGTGPCRAALPHEESSDLKFRIKHIKGDKNVGSRGSGKKEGDRGREKQLEFTDHGASALKLGGLCHKDSRITRGTPQQNLIQDFQGEVATRIDPAQVESRGGNSQAFPCDTGKQDPPAAHVPHSLPGPRKGNAFDAITVDSSGDLSKMLKQPTNSVNHLGHLVPNRRSFKDAPSPQRRDASSDDASDALKEAEALRDYADRLKDSGFGFECNEAYFEAALKFLHSASLVETIHGDSNKNGEMSQMQIYSSTAKLCEICAHEYEKRQEMASAALAYKCMEVAYMRVVYCKNSSTNRDRHDLQASLQMFPQGESPSSSASDVDNLNNQAMVDKAALSKGVGVHAGNHVIIAHPRPNFVRLLDFTKDVNSAMEASRKSQNAFANASVLLEHAKNKEGIMSVKRVIEFGFQDVEELIRLVQLAIKVISRKGVSGGKD